MKVLQLVFGILVCLAVAHLVFGQSPEGVIDYEMKVNMHRNLPPGREDMKNVLPEFRTSRYQLFFTSEKSMYKPVEEDMQEEFESDNGAMRFRFQQPQVEIYFSPVEQRRISSQEFAGKYYLIEDSLQITPWKFGTETKTILGHECRQASYFNEERKQNIVAWYAPSLRPLLGPEIFHTLPGCILEVDVNDGERIITARKITARLLKKNEIKIPNQGTRISQSEFNDMRKAHMEKMRANGANIIIRE